jgi:hypothetical protein
MRFELDVAQHDQLVVALDFLERAREVVVRIHRVAAEPVAIGADHAPGRVEQAFAARILAGPAQQRADGVLGGFAADAAVVIGRGEGVAHARDPDSAGQASYCSAPAVAAAHG